MRLATLTPAIAAAACFTLAASTLVQAKGALQLSPASARPGDTVRVHGIGGFQPDYEARIALVRTTGESRTFYTVASEDALPPAIHLATVQPNDNYEIKADVTIPPAADIAEAFGSPDGRFEIIAIGRNDQLGGAFFVTSAPFELSGVILPAAGSAGGDGLLTWPLWASLGVVGAACIAAGWRFRISRREVRHANTAPGGPAGP